MPTRYTGNDQRIDDALLAVLQRVIATIHLQPNKDETSRAIFALLVRGAHGWQSIRTLWRHSPDEVTLTIDAAVILRCIFDAYLQAAYIVHDPDKAAHLARLYIDYQHVERYRAEGRTVKHDNALSRSLAKSAHRVEGRKRIQEQYDRVKGDYELSAKQPSDKPRMQDKWYRDDLGGLARKAGHLAEYETIFTQLNSCTHSGYLACSGGPMMSGEIIAVWASSIAARLVLLNTKQNQIELCADDRELVDFMSRSFLETEP
jgi:hypothetical protein